MPISLDAIKQKAKQKGKAKGKAFADWLSLILSNQSLQSPCK
jgi:hypothetical protein